MRARNGQVKPVAKDALPSIEGEDLKPKENIPLRAFNAFIPILVLIAALAISLAALGNAAEFKKDLRSLATDFGGTAQVSFGQIELTRLRSQHHDGEEHVGLVTRRVDVERRAEAHPLKRPCGR